MHRVLWGHHAVQQLVASAYQHGFNDAFALAAKLKALERKQEEREAIINWQGLCESGQASPSWD